jgi:regulator of cell morphogenesis and NO signaling
MTSSQPLAQQSLGDIAVHIPGSTAVLRRYKLDFCCGGARTLEDAAREKGLNVNQVEAALAEVKPNGDPLPENTDDIIAHIVTRYHNVHRRELPELLALSQRVETVHAQHPAVPIGLTDLLERIREEMESHMQKEEQVLFPMMLSAAINPMIVHPIGMMRHEHDEHGKNLQAMAKMTNELTPPADACNSWRALYAGLGKLAEDLTEHIHIENNILFPRFEN